MIHEKSIANLGVTQERKKVSDMKPEELDRFLGIEEVVRKKIGSPTQDPEKQGMAVWRADGYCDYRPNRNFVRLKTSIRGILKP